MTLFPILAIILPLMGAAGVFLLSLVPRLRLYSRHVALAALGCAMVALLASGRAQAEMVILSLWRPSLLFGMPLMLQSDAAVQPLAIALVLAACSALLVTVARTEYLRTRFTVTLLASLAAALAALWAANPPTLIIAWAIYDLVQMAAHVAGGSSPRRALRGLILGSLATLLLWGGTLLRVGSGGSELWSLMSPTSTQLALWAAAGILRLWIYPFHLAVPDDLDTFSPHTLLLLSPVVGWGLWLRLAVANAGALPGGTWVPALAAAALALGGFLAWSSRATRRIAPLAGMAVNGVVLLASSLAGKGGAGVIIAGSVAWALGITAFFLHNGLQRDAPWWSIPALIGALTLLGLPLTLGFVAQATLLNGLVRRLAWGWASAFFLGNVFLIPALARGLFTPSTSPLPEHRWQLAMLGAGLMLPVVLLLVAGIHPPLIGGKASTSVQLNAPSLGTVFALPGLTGWLLWAISLACGGVLAWQERNLRPRLELLLGAAHDLLRLEWLYRTVAGALDRGLELLRAADEVVGGAGALLWSLLLFLLILLIWGHR